MKKEQLFLLVLTISCTLLLIRCNEAGLTNQKRLDQNAVSLAEANLAASNVHLSDMIKSIASSKTNGAKSRAEAKAIKDIVPIPDKNNPSYFIVNYIGGGWAVIAGDKRVEPIMAYAEEGEFPKIEANAKIPPGLGMWLANSHNNIKALKQKSVVSANTAIPCQIATAWSQILSTQIAPCGGGGGCQNTYTHSSVGPLLQTLWGQLNGYNDDCPAGSSCVHTPTGCIATTMAQIMYYWKKPISYNWASMGTYYGTPETARLMFDAGNGNPFYIWRCDYSGVTWDGTKYPSLAAQCGFQFTCDAGVTSQFKNKFGYTSANFGNYYFSTVQSNLDAGQPVMLNAHRDENCFLGMCWPIYAAHSWVCDGYQKTDWFDCTCACGGSSIMLHMNWGWENVNSAWVNENNWAVNVNLGDGGGIKNWNYFTSMYSNIKP